MARLELSLRKSFPLRTPDSSAAAASFQLDIALRCEAGITVLFGASGSGKTMTLDALAGFYRADEGRIVLDDAILFDAPSGVSLPPQKRNVGYVFQNYALFPHMTVEENLAFGIQQLPPVERSRRIHEQLDRFGIAAKSGRRPHELSGGEKQRASIARALICQPRLLLLDEPVRGLDHPLRTDFYEILRQVREQHQIPILLVTHNADEAYLLGDRIAVYERGRIVQHQAPEEVFEHPATPSIARLLGIDNVFSGVIDALDPMAGNTRVRAASLAVMLPYLPGRLRGDTVEFCIRQERIILHERDSSPGGASNLLRVRITGESFSPTQVELTLTVEAAAKKSDGKAEPPATIKAGLSRQAYQARKMDERREWLAELPPGAVHVFSPNGSTAALSR